MDDSRVVRRLECFRDLSRNREGVGQRQPAGGNPAPVLPLLPSLSGCHRGRNQLIEPMTLDQFHDEGRASCHLLESEDLGYVRVIQ
jgi:hypothetical protein